MHKNNLHLKRRTEILHASSRVFVKKGFFRTQMEDIARESHLAKGTLYLYFRSKEELFAALFEDIFEQGISNIEKIKNMQVDAKEKIVMFVKSQLEFCEKNLELFMMMDRELHHIEKTLRMVHTQKIMKKYKKIISVLSEIIADGIKEKLIKKIDPVFGSILLLDLVKSIVYKTVKFRKKEKLREQIGTVLDVFLNGVGIKKV